MSCAVVVFAVIATQLCMQTLGHTHTHTCRSTVRRDFGVAFCTLRALKSRSFIAAVVVAANFLLQRFPTSSHAFFALLRLFAWSTRRFKLGLVTTFLLA